MNDTWDFNTPGDYSVSSGAEINSGVARLKAQNYDNDANTSALYHLDESGGTNVTDSSSNGNDATLSGGSFGAGNLNNAVSLDGVDDFASAPDSASLKLGQQQTIESWTKFNNNFNDSSSSKRQVVADKGDYQVYYNNETGKLTYELANNSANTWSQAAGNGTIDGSWDQSGVQGVFDQVKMGSDIYASTAGAVGDAQVWKWDGSTWTMIGGGANAVNGSWDANTYEGAYALATDGTNIYVGLGATAGDGEVWRWNGSSWSKIGGDGANSGWTSGYEYAYSLIFHNGKLYAGLGANTNEAEVWEWNGSSWTKIGGDGVSGSWNSAYEVVYSLASDGTNLYAGLGNTAGDAEVWRWNGSSWTKIGGDGVSGSWNTNYEVVHSLKYFGGNLYAGLGNSAGDGEVWRWNGSSWTMIGGDTINGSWANSTYEDVRSLGWDGTNLYAGLGTGNGDGELWRYDGTQWDKIGGDGASGSWSTNQGDAIMSLLFDGGKLYTGVYDAGGDGLVYTWDTSNSTWDMIGGGLVNKSWGFYGLNSTQVMQAQGGYLYAGMGGAVGAALVYQYDGSNWTLVGGQGINGSWAPYTYEYVFSMASYKGDLYVGLGVSANDAEVWKWDGSTWTKIGGDSVNSGWTANFEEVDSLAADDTYLYAGLGNTGGDGEVWRWDGTSWTRIGGDNINSGWNTYAENVYSLAFYRGELFAGIGRSTSDAELWKWNGSAWSKIGGDGVSGSWGASPDQESIQSLIAYNDKLIVGLGDTAGDADVWQYDGSSWSQIGGDDINSSWSSGTFYYTKTLVVYNGDLYAGLGYAAGQGEVWKYANGTWSRIGGSSLNGGWTNAIERIESFSPYKGKLYVGTGYGTAVDAQIWSWGDNGFLESTVSTFDTNWHHIATTYDGTTMKLYIDGTLNASTNKTLSVATNSRPLLIGTSYGGREYGKPSGNFAGQLDEIRLSNTARSSFTTKPFSNQPQTVELANSIRKNGVWHWDSLGHTDIPNGGTINYRLSDDEGTTWKFWDGFGWVESTNLTEANTPAVITANFETFPVTFGGLKWQAVLTGDGNQRVSIDGVSAAATSDSTDPTANPSNLQAFKANGGSSITGGGWTNGASPYFTWDAGADDNAGVLGYCVYLGTDINADPTTTKGLLGTSPVQTGGSCQFIASGNSLDLATPGLLGTPLTSSNDTVYLNLRTIDKAGNITNTSSQFSFRFDNTPPANPGFITAPSGFINTKEVNMSWPTTGGSAPNDANSGLAGLQYRIGSSGTWYGDAHSGSGDMSDLLANDGQYTTQNTPDFGDLIEGINTVYFRTWDQAGNYTSTYSTATLKINTSGAPSEPLNLVATPSTNTANLFGFNWDAPATYVGDVNNITYCYTVNVIPSPGSCAFTGTGSTELTVGPFATQPGVNTMYVVARDESSNINYANFSSINFTANTAAPGIPLNTDIVDVSIKNTSNWRLALTWDQPTNIGSGISSYRIYRSTDNTNFSQIGASSSTTYIDAGLTQQTYYYNVAACDNTNNCGAVGSTMDGYPTGKFTSPANITSGPNVSAVTTKKATIKWSTDRNSDSKVQIGTQSGQYSPSEVGNSNQVTAHELNLDNLAPGTTYYFKAKWTDEDGNTGVSQEQTFTTAPAPSIKEATVDSVNLSNATISFTTKGAKKAKLYFGASEAFGGMKEVNTSVEESRYQVNLDGLSDGIKYYFMISTIDQEGTEYKGNVATFTTPSRPKISNLRFQPVENEPTSTQKVTWDTNVPSTSQVAYSTTTGSPTEIQDSKMTTAHEITIKNLQDDSTYSLLAFSRDASGNLATSDRQVFKTALDTRPPSISDIVVESSIRGSGSEARGQIVVSWRTDEPSASQVAYSEGSGVTTFNSRSAEDSRLTTEHLVIISDLPTSRVYSVQPLSRDKAQNEGKGEVQTAIISRASDNAIAVIFNTLKSIFGM